MDEKDPSEFLNELWKEQQVEDLRCCSCGRQIDLKTTLARTFCLKSHSAGLERRCVFTRSFEVPELSDEILIFDRHLDCLFSTTKYVAVSHVWPRYVADAQHKRDASDTRIQDVARTVRDVPAQICKGLLADLHGHLELWHDYISVPQWQDDAKKPILQSIHHIFSRAVFTNVYSSDLDVDTYQAMWRGSTTYVRCRAISDMCNIKYFSRMWTAMEFTQSHRIRFMTKDFKLLEESSDEAKDENLFSHMLERWGEETKALGTAQRGESIVGMGHNLVPWQLGPLDAVRRQNSRGFYTTFAQANSLLSRRCVTIGQDFLYALHGTLKLGLGEQMKTETSAALKQMALACLARGDLSPLLMTPTSTRDLEDPIRAQSIGFNDVGTFSLGTQTHDPTYRDVGLDPATDSVTLKAERLGDVHCIIRPHHIAEDAHIIAAPVKAILEFGVSDVDEFVETLGARLFGQDTEAIHARLSTAGRRELLSSKLQLLSQLWSQQSRLWSSPSTTFSFLPSSLRPILSAKLGPEELRYDLSLCLGNANGTFDRLGHDFHLSARNLLLLDNSRISADLLTDSGGWSRSEIDLRALVFFPAEGSGEHVSALADAMGLLDHAALGSRMTPLSPLALMRAHGGTIHGAWRRALVGVACGVCGGRFLLRAAMFGADDDRVVGRATAWRIPGLKFDWTLEGGTGFLLDDEGRRIVGRFVWARRTCGCEKLGEVEVRLHDPPLPRQNGFEYGKGKGGMGWIPVRLP